MVRPSNPPGLALLERVVRGLGVALTGNGDQARIGDLTRQGDITGFPMRRYPRNPRRAQPQQAARPVPSVTKGNDT
jgi:hypothetical protein